MSFKNYVIDKIHLILFYVFIISLISLVVFLYGNYNMGFGSIIYLNILSYTFFIIFLAYDFYRNKNYYENLSYFLENDVEDINSMLPKANNREQIFINKILRNTFKSQSNKIEALYLDKVENMDFITSWVHEIKTPISVSRLIIENSEGKDMEDVLDSIDDELDKIDNYVEQSLYYSKIDDFSKDYLISELDLKKFMNEIIKKNSKMFINKRIGLNMHDMDKTVLTDKKWLLFIVNQVLGNALKYTGKSGNIEIYAQELEKEKMLIIKDNGIGIKEADLSRVFDKGFTGETGREFTKSTGMGLYLAKKMANKLGHNIAIYSKINEYTKVEIVFPKFLEHLNVTKM
ncbi:hypothetical protein SAMN02745163_04034 [Clostridium cavendishii DSM 21758]|uniref:histidine kinase n=1 Tax=Clostridium cavendishii DSM 21758 TaxID=1121302 RepID=A0A1M6TGX6_9CLOT|nr:sensor histidine kinase [Clostridium cavendishii]SHK56261.1 hypothetical protein SAMN02745163_04034 [Clostridium cavendishii DSM 21758]